ncbi:MAG: ABC transporter substrate-binding protein [Candidatus Electryonea clarkiae]|nr:ABC transporter substrate-binding protein [Candidatus Electryonea clarkiae]MDP8285610.1 ABC transporter substrate-binding protein [Candidatus Electryonea clarkiae]
MLRIEKLTAQPLLLATGLLLLTLFTGIISCDDDSVNPPPPPATIRVGALLATEGSAADFGQECKAGIEVAEDDINEYFEDEDIDYEVKIIYEYTDSDEELALVGCQNFRNDEIRLIIGPTTGFELDNVRSYVNQYDLLLVSPSSISIAYLQEDDNIYRISPNDHQQMEAMSALLADDNIEAIVPFARNDSWGDSLLNSMTNQFEKYGGNVLDGVRFDPADTDFSAHLDTLLDEYSEAQNLYPDSTIAVFVLAGPEIASLFLYNGDNYVFDLVNWYGSAANVRFHDLASNASIAELVVKIGGLPSPIFGETDLEDYRRPEHEIELILDWEPDAYALAAYDALWIAVQTYLNLELVNPSFEDLKTSFLEIADGYDGVTGLIELDEVGDRKYAGFDFWKVKPVPDDDEFEWVKFARFEKAVGDSTGIIIRE